MPRRARIDVPGYPLHIVQRGHNRAACFLEPSGFELYLGLLNELHGKFGCSIHAFVLMTNHVHLLLTPGESGAASELLRRVNLRFVQSMNRTYGRTGPGWEGRFWSSVVENGRYLMTCQRYIELNPVRAGLVKSPETYLGPALPATHSAVRAPSSRLTRSTSRSAGVRIGGVRHTGPCSSNR